MGKTIKDDRDNDLAIVGTRTQYPCLRCLYAFSEGDFAAGEDKEDKGCLFSNTSDDKFNDLAWIAMRFPDHKGKQVQILRCARCHGAGQDCYAVRIRAWIGAHWAKLAQIG